MADRPRLVSQPRPFFDVSRGCLCCEVLHPSYDDGVAELRARLEVEQRRGIELAYTVELLLGNPLARLHQAWLDGERVIAAEIQRRMDGPRD